MTEPMQAAAEHDRSGAPGLFVGEQMSFGIDFAAAAFDEAVSARIP